MNESVCVGGGAGEGKSQEEEMLIQAVWSV